MAVRNTRFTLLHKLVFNLWHETPALSPPKHPVGSALKSEKQRELRVRVAVNLPPQVMQMYSNSLRLCFLLIFLFTLWLGDVSCCSSSSYACQLSLTTKNIVSPTSSPSLPSLCSDLGAFLHGCLCLHNKSDLLLLLLKCGSPILTFHWLQSHSWVLWGRGVLTILFYLVCVCTKLLRFF